MRTPAFILAGVFILASLSCTRSSQDAPGKVILRVNQADMTAKDFSNALAARLRSFDSLTVKDPLVLRRTKDEVVKEFLIRIITEDYARAQNILVRKDDLDNEINSVRANYPDDITFRQALADEGLVYKDWQEKVRATVLQKLVLLSLKQKVVPPTEEEMKNYYSANKSEFQVNEQVRLRQVLVSTENDAQNIQDELRRGRSLKELAQKFSIAPEGNKGGDTGWIDRGSLDVFEKAFKLNKGQRSGILKSEFGFHIYEVLDKRKAQTLPYEQVKERVRRILTENREQALYSAWLEGQVRQAKVFKDEKFIDSLRVETKGTP